MGKVTLIEHPLIQHKLTIMRSKETTSKDFRFLLNEISMLMGYEVTRNLATKDVTIETPICEGDFPLLQDDLFTIVPILRAGLGMVEGLHQLMPFAHIGHLGMYRDETTREPIEYYCKMPPRVAESIVIIVDPMLATGGSAVDAINAMKKRNCTNIRLMNLVAAPEGIERVQREHPDVDIFVAAIDKCLNDDAYIVPGLGDAGDRIFGTK